MLLVDEEARDAGQTGERAQERSPLAVEHVDVRVRHVHAAAGAKDVCVVEAWPRPGRPRGESGADEVHAGSPLTSTLHQA